jgi:hypothetical protein
VYDRENHARFFGVGEEQNGTVVAGELRVFALACLVFGAVWFRS